MNAKIAAGLRKRQFSSPFEDHFETPKSTISMSGRQMGKSTLMRELAEQQESLARAIVRSSPSSIGAAATTATAAPPWASKSAEEIVADMKRFAEQLEKSAPVTSGAMIGDGLITAAKIASSLPWPGTKPNMFDDIVASASGIVNLTEEQPMNTSKEEAAKQLAAQINQKITTTIRPGPFKLAGPAQLTIKTRQSQYKKKAFLGDETMSLTSVYGGKREVIAVFKNALPVDYSYIEIPLADATTQLAGFKEYLASLGVADIDTIVAGIEQQKTQTAAAERDELLADPEFASW